MAGANPSRRGIIAAAGLGVGLGGTAAHAEPSSRLDLADPAVAARAAARSIAPLDGRPAWGWVEAEVLACGPTGTLTPVAVYRAVTLDRLEAAGVGAWRRMHAEHGRHLSLDGGQDGSFDNPLTGRRVAPEPFVRTAALSISAADPPAWRIEAAQAVLHERESLSPHAGAQRGSRILSLAHLAAPGFAAVPSTGAWTRTLTWPRGLGMCDAPAHCVMHGRFVGGLGAETDLPTDLRRLARGLRA